MADVEGVLKLGNHNFVTNLIKDWIRQELPMDAKSRGKS